MVDGTLGRGGHAAELMRRISPDGILLGVDRDPTRIEETQKDLRAVALSENLRVTVRLVHGNYADLAQLLEGRRADVILLDLGFASDQLESGRGFSFRNADDPLLMTYDPAGTPVHELLDQLREPDLARILREYGEERYAGRIAKAIVKARPIRTSGRLAEVVEAAVPRGYERGRLHPATRTFQALRMYANQELTNLQQFLGALPELLAPEGRVGIITFHSLEDRIVKNAFRDLAKAGQGELLTKKPVAASEEEIRENPRARSAKLRGLRFTHHT